MNGDCVYAITQFMTAVETGRLSLKYNKDTFPTQIRLTTYAEVMEFYGWCELFDTSNLVEVTIRINRNHWWEKEPENAIYGLVPPSVNILRISVHSDDSYISIRHPLDELYLNHSAVVSEFPESVRKLTLESDFEGVIEEWPNGLEELDIQGWGTGNGYSIVSISNLPDTVHTINLGLRIPIEIHRWPESLRNLRIECYAENQIHQWLDIRHVPVPDGVTVETITSNTDVWYGEE